MAGITHERKRMVETRDADGEKKERTWCMLASKINWLAVTGEGELAFQVLSMNSAVAKISNGLV
jgi:hypothetical protein